MKKLIPILLLALAAVAVADGKPKDQCAHDGHCPAPKKCRLCDDGVKRCLTLEGT